MKIEGIGFSSYGGLEKYECTISVTSSSSNSSVLVPIEIGPRLLLGLARAGKKVIVRIVAQKWNTYKIDSEYIRFYISEICE